MNYLKQKEGKAALDIQGMNKMQELEKQFLLKSIPEGLENCDTIEIIDIYIPKSDKHPKLRIRKNGDRYEMTKKTVVESKGHFNEETIHLTKEEFESLKSVDGKVVHKIRHLYPYNGLTGEVDVFQGDLPGLITVEFEFETIEQLDAFEKPDFCLVDVTAEEFTAGGFLCGKSYKDIEEELKKFGYKKLFLS